MRRPRDRLRLAGTRSAASHRRRQRELQDHRVWRYLRPAQLVGAWSDSSENDPIPLLFWGTNTGEADGVFVGYFRRHRAGISYHGVMAAGQDDHTQTKTGRITPAVPPQLCRRREPSRDRGAAASINSTNSTPGSTLGHRGHHWAAAAGSQADE